MAEIGPSRGILEDAVLQTQFVPTLGHFPGEGTLVTGQALGDDDTGVVARLHHHAPDQILDGNLILFLDEHLRPALAPGPGADGKPVLQGQPPVSQAFEDHIDGHELAHGRRGHGFIGVLL